MKSWRTTAAGIAAIVTVIVNAVTLLTDNNPATNPDWSLVISAVFAGLIGLFSRDNKVTSEAAGAK